MAKKAQGMSMNVIIIAAIALLVLVILSVVFIGRMTTFTDETGGCAGKGGTCYSGGCPSGTSVSYDTHRLHYDELTLMGSFHYTPADVRTAYHDLTERKVDLSLLISGEFPLRDLEKALILLKEGKGIKYVLRPG